MANPGSAALLQAWGLLELQKGNVLAATRMLERSALCEPRNLAVLKWKLVVDAHAQAQDSVVARRRGA